MLSLWREDGLFSGDTYNARMTQNEALAILKTGANVFLTGEPAVVVSGTYEDEELPYGQRNTRQY